MLLAPFFYVKGVKEYRLQKIIMSLLVVIQEIMIIFPIIFICAVEDFNMLQ